MNRTIPMSAGDLKPGMRIFTLGRVFTVSGVRRSLGNGWQVTLEDGPSLSGALTVGVVVSEGEPRGGSR